MSADRVGLAVTLAVQALLSCLLLHHLRDQLNPDATVYGRAAQMWLRGEAGLALNATWGVLAPWSAVPGLALGMDPPRALRAAQVVAALVATIGTHALLGCMDLGRTVRAVLVLGAALYAVWASTIYLTSDASYLAVFVWFCWSLLTPRASILGLPRAFVAGALAGASFLARPVGLPMGIALLLVAEVLRTVERPWRESARALLVAACGWILVAGSWIAVLSIHYGAPTASHSPRVVHAAVGPHTDHPWNLPSFTRLHRPPAGRITTWEDPSLVADPGLDWSPFESADAWRYQVRLLRRNLRTIVGELVAFDGAGACLIALVLLPLVGWAFPRPLMGWREAWLFVCAAIHVAALAPLHVERRYLWPLVPVAFAALGAMAARLQPVDADGRRRVVSGTALLGLLALLLPNIATSALRIAVLLGTPARKERAIAAEWARLLEERDAVGPVASWTPHPWKALDPEGLYLAWALEQPWLANLATDGHDLRDAEALGARVLVAKTLPGTPTPPAWIGEAWSVVATTDAGGETLRAGRYWVLVQRPSGTGPTSAPR